MSVRNGIFVKGFTLVEVLLALAILSVGMAVLLASASKCLAVMKRAKQYQAAQVVFGLGEVEYPMIITEEVEDLEVQEDTGLVEGFTYSREVEEKEEVFDEEDEDHLYILHTKVSWVASGQNWVEEVVRYVYYPEQKKK